MIKWQSERKVVEGKESKDKIDKTESIINIKRRPFQVLCKLKKLI